MSSTAEAQNAVSIPHPGSCSRGRPSDRAGTLSCTPCQATVLCGSSVEKLGSKRNPTGIIGGVPSCQFQRHRSAPELG